MMNRILRILGFWMIGFSMLACNLGNSLTSTKNDVSPSPVASASETSAAVEVSPIPSPTQVEAEALPAGDLEPCSLVTTAEVEAILAEPASPPTPVSGGCTFTNAKDGLYALTVAAAQDQQTNGILQGQAMLLSFAGARLDEARMTSLKTLAAALDYKGFFSELVAAAEGVTTLQARLVEDKESDVVYWTWIAAQTRRQGAYVVVRGPTLININLVVADTQSEESMLAASTSLANKIFERLPSKFTLAMPTAAPQQPSPNATPTIIVGVIETPPVPTTIADVLAAPSLIAPADGTKFSNYPRATTLQWTAVPGASKYVVEIEGCTGSLTNCFPHPMYEKSSRETNDTTYPFSFLGAQPGKWRVWAVDGNGQAGSKSAWWSFSYSR